MKLWKLGVVGIILVTWLAGGASAAGLHGWRAGGGEPAPSSVCAWAGTCRQDGNGDGLCDVCGRTAHTYADADGDGICDHYEAGRGGGGHHGRGGNCRW